MSSPIITTLKEDRYCLMKPPEGASGYYITDGLNRLWYNILAKAFHDELPSPGNWQIVGIGRELGEEQWKEIVDRQNGSVGKYKDYSITGSLSKYGTYLLGTATESGFSWLRSHGADENYLILKEVK